MKQLRELSSLKITQSSSRPTKAQCDRLDHLVIVIPKKPAKTLFKSLPFGEHLRKSFERGSEGGAGRATSRLPNARATGITVATVDDSKPHARLRWARQVVGESLKDKPGRLGVVVLGLDEARREAAVLALAAAAEAAAFELPTFKSERKPSRRKPLTALTIFDAKTRTDLSAVTAEAKGNNLARWLTALPPNELTAASYRGLTEQLASSYGFEHEFLDEAALAKLGAGAFLAVAQGNARRDAGIVRLGYRPGTKATKRARGVDLALVGKGILFDTGGTNLKPFKSMLDMHTDMQGSAVALGTLVALAELEVPYSIDTWLAITENRLSATAYKSQDVVTASNGTTIQVIHTDAEGRMVLADTLAIATKRAPKLLFDYATLTGTCITSLTTRYSGVFTNRELANERLRAAGTASGERVWPFPLDDDYEESLASEVADIKQCSPDGHGDHILAARFLKRFVPDDVPWVHMDLSAGQHKGGLGHVPTPITGFGVRYTVELLRAAGGPAALGAEISD